MLDFRRSTRFKMRIAQILYRGLRLAGFSRQQLVRRGGVRFELDLAEGIDLSLFLFGRFQSHVTESRYFSIAPGSTLIDVGANIGSICLPLLVRIPDTYVHAFEPTHYAWGALQRNIALNPDLADRLTAIQAFVGEDDRDDSELIAYSSWRIDDLEGSPGEKNERERHPVHLGKRSDGTLRQMSLDGYVERAGIDRVDFIKIDTDGNEVAVLRGARRVLAELRPVVVFEISTYIMKEREVTFSDYAEIFDEADYRLLDSATGEAVNADSVTRIIPTAGTADILALPNSRESTGGPLTG